MISDRMQSEINNQINAELYSEYLYLAMSAYCESLNLKGAAHWFKMQAKEEKIHATKFYDYVNAAGGRVKLAGIGEPPFEWKSILDAFENALSHEKKVTAMINHLVDVAIEEKDHATNAMLQWFVNEQVEEEESASEVVAQLKLVGDGYGMYMVDKELGTRLPPVEAPPA